jgi:hypothetical protein
MGAGMWVWSDEGGQFSDYDGPFPSYSMVYATGEGPISSKRREAWREGVEDAELWRLFRQFAQETANAEGLKLARQSPAQIIRAGDPQTLLSTRRHMLRLFR